MEVANPVPAGVNERAVLVARRNTLMSELLRIAPSINPPAATKPYEPSGTPRTVQKREPVKPPEAKKPKPTQPTQVRGDVVAKPKSDVDAFADNPNLHTVNGVHIDIYDYFAINPDRATNEQRDRMFFIHQWVLKNGKTFRDGLKKLNSLDNRLGSADAGEAKVIKLYNYLRLRYGNAKA